MKCLTLFSFFILLANQVYSQDFITKWVFSDTASQIQFSALTTDTVHYTWTASPSGNSGNGNFTAISPSDVILSTLNIETGDTLTLNMAPENLSHFSINNGPDKEKLIDVVQWGDVTWTTMFRAFYGASNLIITATDVPDLSNVNDMRLMFTGATSFNQYIGDWDVSNVTDMAIMFGGATSFNQDIGDWDVSNVINMSSMFAQAKSFDQNIGRWDVSNVISMSSMFYGANSFNQDISGWNVSKVIDMSGMFLDAISFDRDISNWPVFVVTHMGKMFSGAHSFNQDISAWDVSLVTNMDGMFQNASSFNQDISTWNTSNVTNMKDIFKNASSFNRSIINWDVSLVTDMRGMFEGANSFNQDIGDWILHPDIRMNNMLDSSGMDCVHYSVTLVGWQANNPSITGVTLGAAGLQYGTSAVAARDSLINEQMWSIMGDEENAMDCDGIVSAASTNQRAQITIYPNPTSDRITITGDLVDLGSIRMYNSIGQDVTAQVIIEKQSVTTAAINLSGLHNGIFILRCVGASKMIYKE